MKTENTPEAKARFFSLYWGQRVLIADSTIPSSLYPLSHWNTIYQYNHFKNSQLELAPLFQISDEDAIEVAKLMKWNRFLPSNIECHPLDFSVSISDINWIKNESNDLSIYPIKVGDFLRSRGYYVGDGTEIEYGWVKLKGATPCK